MRYKSGPEKGRLIAELGAGVSGWSGESELASMMSLGSGVIEVVLRKVERGRGEPSEPRRWD